MAITREDLQAQRDQIISEMGLPLQISQGDRSKTRRSQADLDAALARIDAEIARLDVVESRGYAKSWRVTLNSDSGKDY